jgi:hypothetical protein
VYRGEVEVSYVLYGGLVGDRGRFVSRGVDKIFMHFAEENTNPLVRIIGRGKNAGHYMGNDI